MTPAEQKLAKPASPRLAALRTKVESVDDLILGLIVKRAELARKIGSAKKRMGLPVLDPAREAQVVRRAAAKARELGMPNEEVRTLFWQIIALCRAEQLPGTRKRPAKKAAK